MYWYSVKLALDLMICICCFMEDIPFYQYVNEQFHVSWHWLHLSGTMLMDALIVFLVYIMRGKSLILCRRKRSYIFLALFVIMEMIMDQYLFSNELVSGTISRTYIVFAVLIMMLFLCGGIITWIMKNYMDVNYKQRLVNAQFLMAQEQYRILKELYNQKRKQIHDTVQQDINRYADAERYVCIYYR